MIGDFPPIFEFGQGIFFDSKISNKNKNERFQFIILRLSV